MGKGERRESGVLRERERAAADKSKKESLEQELEVLRVAFTALREGEKKRCGGDGRNTLFTRASWL